MIRPIHSPSTSETASPLPIDTTTSRTVSGSVPSPRSSPAPATDAQQDRPHHAGAVRRGVEPDLRVGGEQHERGAAAARGRAAPRRVTTSTTRYAAPRRRSSRVAAGSPSSRYARARTPTAASDCGAVSPGRRPRRSTAPSTTSSAAKVEVPPEHGAADDRRLVARDRCRRCPRRRPRPSSCLSPRRDGSSGTCAGTAPCPTTSQTTSTTAVSAVLPASRPARPPRTSRAGTPTACPGSATSAGRPTPTGCIHAGRSL